MKFNGTKLKKIRIAHDPPLTHEEVAAATGISQSYLSYLENDEEKEPRSKTVKKLCDFFKINEIQFYIDEKTIREIFPPHLDNKTINFINEAQNLKYLNMAMKLKEIQISESLFESLIIMILRSRENQEAVKKTK